MTSTHAKVDAEFRPQYRPSDLCFEQKKMLEPKEEMRFCANYEFARSIPFFVKAVLKQRKVRLAHSWSARISSSGTIWQLDKWLAHHVREFPDTPWEGIPQNRRQQILALAPEQGWKGLRDWGSVAHYDQERGNELELGALKPEATFLLEMDFRENDTSTTEKFSTWITAKREELKARFAQSEYGPSPTIRRRGRGNNPRYYRDLLTKLGNYWKILHNEEVYAEAADNFRLKGEIRELFRRFTWEQPSDSWTFRTKDFKHLPAFAGRLKQHADPLSAMLWDRLSETTREELTAYENSKPARKALRAALTGDLTVIIRGEPLDKDKRLAKAKLPKGIREEIAKIHDAGDRAPANRRILESGFPNEIAKPVGIRSQSGFIL